MKTLYKDFLEFFKLLENHNVEYLLVGGYAVSFYGYPRVTLDIDIWIKVSKDNSIRITDAIREFGFDADDLNENLFRDPKCIIRMGVKPQLIEILTTISGVNFDECYKNRMIAEIDGVKINIIDIENLKKNKASAGRPKDIADLEYLL